MNTTVGIKRDRQTLADGTQKIYLNLRYNTKGVVKRPPEKTGKWLYPKPKTSAQRAHNKDAESFVEKLKIERQRELDYSSNGLVDLQKRDGLLSDAFRSYIKDFGSDWGDSERGNYERTLERLNQYAPNASIRRLNPTFSKGFYTYLCSLKKSNGQPLSKNSANVYFAKYKMVAKYLWKSGLLNQDPTLQVKTNTSDKKQAPSLTEEELQVAINTPISKGYEQVRNAWLFACLTGLRVSDLIDLKWEHFINQSDGSILLKKVMWKTKRFIQIYLSEQALELAGEPTENRVFPQVNTHAYQYEKLRMWMIGDCGINKRITWHSARHTFAYRYLRHHKNPVNLMHLLGHTNIKTTQIYFNYNVEDTKPELMSMPRL